MKTSISALLLLLALSAFAAAQSASDILKPPPGHKVAIVVFEDMECPDCGRAAPLLDEAERTYHVPQVRYDFPLQMHPWAHQAAIYAKYFDTKDTAKGKFGDQFRDFIFANQPQITVQNLRSFVDQFAAQHKLTVPLFPDPSGELEKKVQHDIDLGTRVGIQHTPTIYVVSSAKTARPFVEVVDRSQLFEIIDAMKKDAGDTGTAAKTPAKKSGAKKTAANTTPK